MRAIRSMAVAGMLAGLAACASDPLAASQPISKNASREERDAVRDYHMSKACQEALEQKVEVSFPAKPRKD